MTIAKTRLPPWSEWYLGSVQHVKPSVQEIEKTALNFGVSIEEVVKTYDDIKKDLIVLNSRYQVNIRKIRVGKGWPDMIHLSIKRLDKDRVGKERYRDFLRIKNELVGPECEAVELYPAMSRNVDTANQYHLWVLETPVARFPFGFTQGKMLTNAASPTAKQHPFGVD